MKKFQIAYDQAMEELSVLECQSDKQAIVIEAFFRKWKVDLDDEMIDGTAPLCWDKYCTGVACRYQHLNQKIYCTKRYTCDDPECELMHYDKRRSNVYCRYCNKNCPGYSQYGCCTLPHLCIYEIDCNNPNCIEPHPDGREENICYYDTKCRKRDCPLTHSDDPVTDPVTDPLTNPVVTENQK